MLKPKPNKTKNAKKLTPKEFTYLAIVAALYAVFVWTYDRTINYPGWEYVKIIIIFEVVMVAFYHKWALQQLRESVNMLDRLLVMGFLIISGFIISTFACGILLLPVNFYNLHYAKNNSAEPFNCHITSITDVSRSHAIYYDFKGHLNSIHVNFNSSPKLRSLADKMDYNNYTLVIYARKGLLDTYVFSSWELKRNTLMP